MRSAMWRITVAEQFTVEQSAMKLRVPTRPSARRMPLKVAPIGSRYCTGLVVDADLVVLVVLAHRAIVDVHVRAGRECPAWRSR